MTAITVTDEMVERALDMFMESSRWRKGPFAGDWRLQMRNALTAALSAAPQTAPVAVTDDMVERGIRGVVNYRRATRSNVGPISDPEFQGRMSFFYAGEDIEFQDIAAEVRAALASALSAGPVQADAPSGWQPIETAPRDGSIVILARNDERYVGWWTGEKPYPWAFVDDGMLDRYGKIDPNGWPAGDRGPNCWMPLPAPPAGEGV